jgi:AcrR family transcriptional regulator
MPKVIDHDETRQNIADAFVRVVAAKGSAGVTMRDIAREAGCSQTLPSYYFEDRNALVEFAFERQANRSVNDLESFMLGPLPVQERLLATITWLMTRSITNEPVWRTIIGLIVDSREGSRIRELDQKCYHQFLEHLEALILEFADATGQSIDAEADALLLLTCTDGLALAAACLGSEARKLIPPLMKVMIDRYALVSP